MKEKKEDSRLQNRTLSKGHVNKKIKRKNYSKGELVSARVLVMCRRISYVRWKRPVFNKKSTSVRRTPEPRRRSARTLARSSLPDSQDRPFDRKQTL
jgi:hypothetical protein